MVTTLRLTLALLMTLSLGVSALATGVDVESGSGAGQLSPFWGGAISQWSHWILYWAAERELDPDLVAAVVRQESLGQSSAQGPYGSVGLMMVLPAEVSGMPWRPTAEELKQPNLNVRWGTGILAEVIRESGGDLLRALAAYNGGWDQVHLPSTERYAHSVLTFYAHALAGRHGHGYQESKIWSLVLMTRVDGHIERIQVRTSGHYLAPCFEGALEFRKVFPEMVDAPRTRVAHFVDEGGHDVLVDAWLFVGEPERPSGETLVSTTAPSLPRIGHRP